MRARTVLYGLLLIVAAAAAVLSFAALRDLARLCGFAPQLAWLLPVVVDAGAAAGSLVWLGGWSADAARRFARSLALVLLGLSVAANALGHGLAAFALAPAWWVVVIVSAVAPAVLGAVVHLAVLVGRPEPAISGGPPLWLHDEAADVHAAIESAVKAGRLDERGLSRLWDQAPTREERAAVLIADGAGRRRLARELGISEYEARQLIDQARTTNAGDIATTEPATDIGTTSTEQYAAPDGVHALNGSGRTRS
jgi:hypothetical protein